MTNKTIFYLCCIFALTLVFPAMPAAAQHPPKPKSKPPAAKSAYVKAKLSQFITRFTSKDAKRGHNIRAAVKKINGFVLQPGQVFSLNKTVGERTHANGYLTAPVYVKGKLVAGIGGGVSQVTGTLFNAALLAGLPIVEYGTHFKPVAYLPIARDATIAWNHIDLRFKNNTRAPITINYKVRSNRCIAVLYGAKPPGQQVRLSVHSVKINSHRISAVLYRVIKKNGKLIRKEKIGRSEYNWKPETSED